MKLTSLVLASGNRGKIEEIETLLAPLKINILPQSHFDITEAEETGSTFVENAIIKARHASLATQLPALADDSGLIIDALDGRPGVYSARYAGADTPHAIKMQYLLDEIQNVPVAQRSARFYCAMALLRYPEDPAPLICEGQWEGQILLAPQGEYGFGYDPLFYVPAFDCSAAELSLPLKNQHSHRAKALTQLLARLATDE